MPSDVLGYVLLVVALGCWAGSLCALAHRVRALNVQVNRQAQLVGQLERRVDDALVLARKRLVAGRSGR
jgi:hypothetical protein